MGLRSRCQLGCGHLKVRPEPKDMPPKWQTHRDVTGASVLHRVRLLVGLLEGPSDVEAGFLKSE